MEAILDQFEIFMLSRSGVSLRTYSVYIKDIRDFIAFLKDQEKTDFDQLTTKDIQNYFEKIKNRKLSHAYGVRIASALRFFCGYLHEKLEMPDLREEITRHQSNLFTQFPVLCSSDKMESILKAYQNPQGYKEFRDKLILRLLHVYKLNVKDLTAITINQSNSLNVLGKNKLKKIEISSEDEKLVEAYRKSLLEHMPLAKTTDYLFPVKHSLTLKPISQQAIWAILKQIIAQLDRVSSNDYLTRSTNDLVDSDLKLLYQKKHPRP